MCGIFGIWNRDGRPVDVETLRAGTAALRHRGPDDEGYVLVNTRTGAWREFAGADTAAGVDLPPLAAASGGDFDLGMGHRRLAILDLSAAGHQPMMSRDRRSVLVYNGEVYNFRELRSELSGLGYSFGSETDTEVVLAGHRQWGRSCVTRFNGDWSFRMRCF